MIQNSLNLFLSLQTKSYNTTENSASAECHSMLSQGRPQGKGSLNCSGPLASNYLECFWRFFRIDIPVSPETSLASRDDDYELDHAISLAREERSKLCLSQN